MRESLNLASYKNHNHSRFINIVKCSARRNFTCKRGVVIWQEKAYVSDASGCRILQTVFHRIPQTHD
jgi:hypothetical protein